MIKGITQLNQIITDAERDEILAQLEKSVLSSEEGQFHYGNSFGAMIESPVFDRLTQIVSNVTMLKVSKSNAYVRIYKDGSYLREHLDRSPLDLTLSIQLKNTFNVPTPIYARGYDGTVYESNLNDRDSVLLKGRELPHWRNEINGEGELICIFFHWKTESLEYIEIGNFMSKEECDEAIADMAEFGPSMIKYQGKPTVVDSIRDNKVKFYNKPYIDDRLRGIVGNIEFEGLQMLKYDKGNKFTRHFDDGMPKHRLYTMVIYLNDDCEGGETHFPTAGVTIKPKTGKLLVFKNTKGDDKGPYGLVNPLSLHESLPIKEGIKYALVNWGLIDR